MSFLDLETLPPFFLENKNFFRATLFCDFRNDLHRLEDGLTYAYLVTINHHQHIFEMNGIADIAIEFLNTQLISTGNLILFSASSYYRIHLVEPH